MTSSPEFTLSRKVGRDHGLRSIPIVRPDPTQGELPSRPLQTARRPLRPLARTAGENHLESSQEQRRVIGWLHPCDESSPLASIELERSKSTYKIGRRESTNDIVFPGTHVSTYRLPDTITPVPLRAILTSRVLLIRQSTLRYLDRRIRRPG